MKKTLIALCLIVASVILYSCGGEQVKPPNIRLDNALIDLPRAVNAPEQAGVSNPSLKIESYTVEDDIIQDLGGIYNPIRDVYTPLASAVVDYADTLLELIDTNIFDNPAVMQILYTDGEFTYSDNETGEKIRVTRNENTYGVEFWNFIDDTLLKILDVEFTVEDSRTRGTIHSREPRLDSEYRPEYRIDFDTHDPDLGKVMELKLVNLDFDDPDIDDKMESYNIPVNLWLKAYGDNETLYIAANIAYQNIYIGAADAFGEYFMTILNNDVPYVDGTSRVDVNYIYRGAIDVVNDRGKVDLALVPAAIDDTEEIFSDYSVGNVYKKAITDWIRFGSENGMIIMDAVNMVLAAAGSKLVLSESSDDETILDALVIVKDYFEEADEDVSGLEAVLFVVELENPGYLNAESGFVGNDNIRRPDWADDIPAADDIDILSAAEVSGDEFEVVMPRDGDPDF